MSLVVLIATGGWQYLKGLLDAESPIYMATVYRIHYIAASLLIFVTATFVTDWLLRGERSLTLGKGHGVRGMRGLAHELPKPLGSTMAYVLGLDMRRAAQSKERDDNGETDGDFCGCDRDNEENKNLRVVIGHTSRIDLKA